MRSVAGEERERWEEAAAAVPVVRRSGEEEGGSWRTEHC
jgi:hypothetical protein